MKTNGVFYRKLRIYIFLIFFVLSTVGIGLFEYQQVKLYQKEQNEDELIALNAYSEKIDRDIQGLFEYVDLMSNKSEVIQFASKELNEGEKIKLYKEMRDNFLIRNFSNASIILYKPEYDCFVSENGIEHLSEVKKQYGDFPYLQGDVEELDKQLATRIKSMESNEINDGNIVFVKRKTINFEHDVCFLIVLKKSIIEKELDRIEMNSFYIKDNGINLFEYINEDKDISSSVLWKESKEVLNWEYGMARKELKIPSTFSLQTIVIFLLLVILSLFASKYIASKIYLPIQKVLGRIYDNDDVYDEFNALEEAFVRLEEGNSNLSVRLDEYNSKLKMRFLADIFKGGINFEYIESEKKNFSFKVDGEEFLIAVILVDDVYAEKSLNENIFEKLLKDISSDLTAEYFFNEEKEAVLMYPVSKSGEAESHIIEKAAIVEKRTGAKVRVVLYDKLYSDIFQMRGAYIESILLDLKSLFYQERIVIQKKDICEKNNDDCGYYYSLEAENKLISYIKSGDETETFNILKYIFDENFVRRKLTSDELVELKFALIATSKRVVSVCGLDEKELTQGKGISEHIIFSHQQDKLWEFLESFYKNVFKELNSEEQDRQTLLFKKINQFVLQNFCKMNEISAVSIATQFNVSTSYIYKLYKKMTNKSFIDYVLELRMEEAKKLLESLPWLKVNDIAKQVGYENPTSFMRVFKKMTGLSPTQYRLKNGEK